MNLRSLIRKEYIYVVGMLALGSTFHFFYEVAYSDFEIFASGCGCVFTTMIVAESVGN